MDQLLEKMTIIVGRVICYKVVLVEIIHLWRHIPGRLENLLYLLEFSRNTQS